MGQRHLFRGINIKHDLMGCMVCITLSILFFAWHLQAYYSGQHLLHIILFYPVNIGFLFGVLYGCKCLDFIHSKAIVNISIGTLVVIGLHIVLITITNYVLGYALGIKDVICYQWYEALPITIIIIALLYPIILLCKRHFPLLYGKYPIKF